MQYAFLLGNNAGLSATEAMAALRGDSSVSIVETAAAYLLIETAQVIQPQVLTRIGGSDRVVRVLGRQASMWTPEELLPLLRLPAKKVAVGFSGFGVSHKALQRLALDMKKAAKPDGVKIQFILPKGKTSQLNAAQVLFNALHRTPNREVTIIKTATDFIVAETVHVQDIQAYELRDTSRPARDARVGMLPPKLAQIMLNISLGQSEKSTVLDPFCGLGTVVQEGWLMGHAMYGTDVASAMVEATRKNVVWLAEHFPVGSPTPTVEEHDATQPFPSDWNGIFDAIVTEPNLGAPQSTPLPRRDALQLAQPLHHLYLQAFENFRRVLKPGATVLFLLPAWRLPEPNAFTLFPEGILDEVEKLGYSMKHVVPKELLGIYPDTGRKTLLYARPDALVARELTLWEWQG